MKLEPLTEENLIVIRRAFPGVQGAILRLDHVDVSRGVGILSDGCKCVWTKDGHRIELSQAGGARMCSYSKEPDPEAPESA